MDDVVPTLPATRHRKRPGDLGRVLGAVGVATVLLLAGAAVYTYELARAPTGEPVLTIYAYSSLFGGNGSLSVYDQVFGAFERAHGVRIDLEYPSGTLASTLVAEKNAPGADLVIGLDEITAPQADAHGVLLPYSPPGLSNVSPSLIATLAPDHSVTPYEYGYLSFDFNQSDFPVVPSSVQNISFPGLASNGSLARSLVLENPETDITGEEFLLYEIAFFEHVLNASWLPFWQSIDPHASVVDSWSTAWSEFTAPSASPAMTVSYSTDPAYAAANGAAGTIGATVASWEGVRYAWQTVYGIGIVAGSPHVTLDQEFIDWFLSGAVQSEIPTNEWEYPANNATALPSVFSAAVNTSGLVPLDSALPPATIVSSLPGWLDDWQSLYNVYGASTGLPGA
ncbi:MAG: thiamine ABC transporter substrate-binding protein [Thermoplasmata archaeon]|nr:thiamine ABC transporter substrate-binding protein [Thermoplasmata archaeon]